MELKTGSWKINIFGMEGKFNISAVITGTLNANISDMPFNEFNGIVRGFFDETSQEIIFGVADDSGGGVNPINTILRGFMFKGALFCTPKLPEPGQDIVWHIAGTLEIIDHIILRNVFQSNSRRTKFGWMAQITDTQ